MTHTTPTKEERANIKWNRFVEVFTKPLQDKLKQAMRRHMKIPVHIDELQTDLDQFDEGIVYGGIVRNCALADKEDKNGNAYITGVYVDILDPEQYRGRSVACQYMPILSPGQKPKSELDLMFPRFIKAFKVPYDQEGFDPMDAIGCEGQFTVKNDVYQGKKSGKVQDWLL